MGADQPLVSIVTPVYNGARYLRESLDSVLSQTYDNWEHVILDNCSTDATPEIIAEHAARDARVRVFRNDHLLPVIENHNAVVKLVSEKGHFLKIVHADDRLSPDCIARLVGVAERHPTVALVGSLIEWGGRTVAQGLDVNRECFPGQEICRRTLLGEIYLFWCPSALMYRSSALRGRERLFMSSHLHADVQSYYEVLEHSDFGFVHDRLCFARAHKGSVTSAETAPYNKLLASNLDLLVSYGPRFLDEAAFEQRQREYLDKYYDFLARSALSLRDRDFWRFHASALGNAGLPISYPRVAYTALRELLLQPRRSIRGLLRGISRPAVGDLRRGT